MANNSIALNNISFSNRWPAVGSFTGETVKFEARRTSKSTNWCLNQPGSDNQYHPMPMPLCIFWSQWTTGCCASFLPAGPCFRPVSQCFGTSPASKSGRESLRRELEADSQVEQGKIWKVKLGIPELNGHFNGTSSNYIVYCNIIVTYIYIVTT